MGYQKKCYCQEPLRPDGTCRWGCAPSMSAPARRASAERKLLMARDEAAKSTLRLDKQKLRRAARAADPLYAAYCADLEVRRGIKLGIIKRKARRSA